MGRYRSPERSGFEIFQIGQQHFEIFLTDGPPLKGLNCRNVPVTDDLI